MLLSLRSLNEHGRPIKMFDLTRRYRERKRLGNLLVIALATGHTEEAREIVEQINTFK